MALATVNIVSKVLHRPMPVTLLLPDSGRPEGVLFLLHGFSDCHATIVQNSALVRYCSGTPLLVIMPEAGCSFYADSPAGQYWQYLTRELPQALENWFQLPQEKSCRFVGGISMGGYGAVKWALQFPEKFAAAFLLAPVTDLAGIREHGFDRSVDPNAPSLEDLHLDELFPGKVEGTREDLYFLLNQADPKTLPESFLYTGTEDFLFQDICRFSQALKEKGEASRLICLSGIHDWPTWEEFLKDMICEISARLKA